ncbi:MAG: PilC/PilY family type IV pilus protein [Pseudomonadaceae bacterium]
MINLKTLLGSRLLACCLGLALPMVAQADDTEIYFARANAENAQNTPKANVLIMLDTSSSMRSCEVDRQTQWCSDVANRRITMLHNAMNQIIADAPSNVEIGLGRFWGTGNSSRGKILLPVMPVNDLTRDLFEQKLNSIDNGDEPKSYTPTAIAYNEMAKYMLGHSKSSDVTYSGDELAAVCVSNAPDQEVCRDEVQWSDPVEVPECDTSLPGCSRSEYWNVVPSCDLSSPDCRLVNGHTTNWCDLSLENCECTRWRGNGTCRRYQEYEYSQKINLYTWRDSSVVQVCESIPGECDDSRSIIQAGRYVSPVNTNNQCETNHVILFTDGTPTVHDSSKVTVANCGRGDSYSCQVAVAAVLNSVGNSKGVPIKTHNIGLYMGSTTLANMQEVSGAGGGETYDSDSAETLLEAFQSTLDLIDEDARSISAPGVAVNAMNRFQHLDQLYYSVFQPFESSYWNGNLKRYQVADGVIQGQNGYATDPATGYFRTGSQSIWSSVVDGPDVTKGGAREHVGARNLFYTLSAGGDLQRMNWSSELPSNTQLGLSEVATGAQRAALLSELKTMWGDPLHSVPVMVNYGESADNNYVFVSNNGGMLHAIDTEDGSEAFAFMPYEILQKANQYTIDRPSLRNDNTRRTYGLDGSWVAWRQGGTNALAAPEAVYLYGGMRRGGRNYYALDVTDPTAPAMLWQVNNGSTGMAGLGQTWSTPTLTSVPDGDGNNVPVLVVGGGYSPSDHDGTSTLSAGDQMGNMVYFLNAATGEVLWSAGGRNEATRTVTDMKWAVPSGIAVVDIDFDGVADHMYYGDMAGQVFRITIKDDAEHVVERIANLGGTGSSRRRFYEAPAVGLVRANTGNELYVVIGSGYRAHPLDETVTDGVFVIRDRTALNGSGSQTVATTANMTNVTAGGQPLSTARGWYYTFSQTGEKSLASPVIFNGRILFTTYAPTVDQESENPCAVRYGRAYLHTVNLLTALPAALSDDLPAPASRSQALEQSTPAPTPTLLVDDEGDVVVVVGTEAVGESELGDPRLRKRRWMQLPPDEANSIKQSSVVQEDEQEAGGEDE